MTNEDIIRDTPFGPTLLAMQRGEFYGDVGDAVLDAAVKLLADCNSAVLHPRGDGPALGDILRAYQFKQALQERGLMIIPIIPTLGMRAAWKRGWVRTFTERYSAMLRAVWKVESNPSGMRDDETD